MSFLELIADLLDEEVPLSAWAVSERGRKSLIMQTDQLRGRAEVRREFADDGLSATIVVEGDTSVAPASVLIRRGQYGKVLFEVDCEVGRKGQRYEVSAEIEVNVDGMAEAVGKAPIWHGRRIKS